MSSQSAVWTDERVSPALTVVGAASGMTVFPLSLVALNAFALRVLRLSSAQRAAPVVGAACVGVAGLAASAATLYTPPMLLRAVSPESSSSSSSSKTAKTGSRSLLEFEPAAWTFYACASVVFMRAVTRTGFASVLPSDLCKPGAFHRNSIPATAEYATNTERAWITAQGKKHGCHSCGSRHDYYIADHQPPQFMMPSLPAGTKQRFYPQCSACSGMQMIAGRTRQRVLKFPHPTALLRAGNLWLPWPLLRPYVSPEIDLAASQGRIRALSIVSETAASAGTPPSATAGAWLAVLDTTAFLIQQRIKLLEQFQARLQPCTSSSKELSTYRAILEKRQKSGGALTGPQQQQPVLASDASLLARAQWYWSSISNRWSHPFTAQQRVDFRVVIAQQEAAAFRALAARVAHDRSVLAAKA